MSDLNPISRWPWLWNCPKCGLELVCTNEDVRENMLYFRCKGFPKCFYNCVVKDDDGDSDGEFPSFNEFPDLDKLAQEWGWDNWEAFDESRE